MRGIVMAVNMHIDVPVTLLLSEVKDTTHTKLVYCYFIGT